VDEVTVGFVINHFSPPAHDSALNQFPGALVPKAVSGSPAGIGQQIRPDMILAEKLDEGVGRGSYIGDKVVEAGRARSHVKTHISLKSVVASRTGSRRSHVPDRFRLCLVAIREV